MKKFLTVFLIFTSVYSAFANNSGELSIGGIKNDGSRYNQTPGFFTSSQQMLPQIGNNAELTFRMPPQQSEGATISILQPTAGNSAVVIPNLYKDTLTVNKDTVEIKFAQSPYQHRSTSDFKGHFTILRRKDSMGGPTTSSPYLAYYTAATNKPQAEIELTSELNLGSSRIILAADNKTVFIYDQMQHYGLFVFNGTSFTEHAISGLPSDSSINGAAFANNGSTLFCIQNNTLFRFDNIKGSPSQKQIAAGLINPETGSLQSSENGDLLVYNAASVSSQNKKHLQALFSSDNGNSYAKKLLPFVDIDCSYYTHVLTPDGRFLACAKEDSIPGKVQIYRWDFTYSRLQLISTVDGSPADGICYTPQISPNGKNIVFITKATNFLNKFGISPDVHQIFIKKNIPELPRDANGYTYDLISYYDRNIIKAPSRVYTHLYKSVHTDWQGAKTTFTTTADLSTIFKDQEHAYMRDQLQPGSTFMDSNDITYIYPALSGDGNLWAGYANGMIQFSNGKNIKAVLDRSPLLSYDGSSILYLDSAARKLMMHHQGNSFELQNFSASNIAISKTTYPISLSADGRLALFLGEDNQLKLWFADIQQSRPALMPAESGNNVQEAAMSVFGSIIYFKNYNGIFRYDRLNKKTDKLSIAGSPFRIQCSGNGRYLIYLKDNSNQTSLYRFDSSTNQEICIAEQTELNDQNSAVDFSGRKIIFSSPLTFENHIIDTNATNDLYMATAQNQSNTAPSLISPTYLTICNDIPGTFDFSFSDPDGDDAWISHAEATTGNAKVNILAPDSNRPWYSINVIPVKNNTTPITLSLTITDGTAFQRQEVTLSINQIPEWTTDFSPVRIDECSSLSLDPADYAKDYNSGDVLSFVLPTELPFSGMKIENGKLVITPECNTVSHKDETKTFTVNLKVKDKSNTTTKDEKTLTITVQDVDQPPVIDFVSGRSSNMTQNETISLTWFKCSDPDIDDRERSYTITLKTDSGHGSLQSSDNRTITLASNSQTPINYIPINTIYNTDTIHVSCENTLPSKSIDIIVHLKQLQPDLNSFWQLGEKGGTANKTVICSNRWNLLSVPVEISGKILKDTFGAESILQVWDSSKSRYKIISNETTIPAGAGFWLYCNKLPANLPSFTSTRPDENYFDLLASGWHWHLQGPVMGQTDNFIYPDKLHFRYAGQSQTFNQTKTNASPLRTGTAAWLWLGR